MAVIAQGSNFSFECDNEVWFLEGEARRRVTRAVEKVVRSTNERLMYNAKLAYPWAPMVVRFHRIQSTTLAENTFVSGISSDDPVFGVIIYRPRTRPHMPPPNRNGEPGTGIEGWVDRLPGPQPGYKDKISVWQVRQAIKKHGTEAKDAIYDIVRKEAAVFAHNVGAAIDNELMTLT